MSRPISFDWNRYRSPQVTGPIGAIVNREYFPFFFKAKNNTYPWFFRLRNFLSRLSAIYENKTEDLHETLLRRKIR